MHSTPKSAAQASLTLCWHLVLLCAVGMAISMIPDAVFAQATGSGGPAENTSNAIQQVFCNIVILLNGLTGKAIATVAVIAVGVGALLGKISWGMALIVALGVALIFGAASIVTALGGESTACTGSSIRTTT